MLKTTVYLPADLREALARAAARRGQTEAQVIRDAIRHEVIDSEPAPTFPVFHSGKRDPFAERDEELLEATGFGRC